MDGPLLVFAGPGTGKTRVVVNKMVHLLRGGGYKPSEVLALTFSENAAQEMQDRVGEMLPGIAGVRVSTFHSFCFELIREYPLEVGINLGASVIADEHQQSFLLQNMDDIGLQAFKIPTRPIELSRSLQRGIQRLKQEYISIERLEAYLEQRRQGEAGGEGKVDGEEIAQTRDLAKAYRMYEQFKEQRGLIDFSDMQQMALDLLKEWPSVLERVRRRIRYIIVDEFQDTDYIQLQLVLLLASEGNITVVGDDDQSIYRFRGAYLTNIHEFKAFYQGTGMKTYEVVLRTNYRCSGNIQAVASTLIRNNPERQPKDIVTQADEGAPVTISAYPHDWDQAVGIARRIKGLNDAGLPLEDIAVLVRRRVDAKPIVEALEKARIPFEEFGSREYFRQPVVKAVVSYLKVLHDPATNQPAIANIMRRPVHGIMPGEMQKLTRHARDRDLTLWDALGDLAGFEGDSAALEAFRKEMEGLFRVYGEMDLMGTVRAVVFG